MDENDNIPPPTTRRLSDRKSKPSMEALVDHHRPVYWFQTPQPPQHQHRQPHPQPSRPTDEPTASPTVLERDDEANIVKVATEPMRIRIRLARLDPASLPNSSIVVSSPSSDSPNLPFSSNTNGMPAKDEDIGDSDEDNLPLSDLCKRVAHPHEPSPERVEEEEPPKKRPNRRRRLLAPPSSPPPSPQPPPPAPSLPTPRVAQCRCCAQPATSSDLRWDGQFCSPDCIIKACRDAFSAHRRLQTFTNSTHNSLPHQTVS